MTQPNALETFIARVRACWAPISSSVVAQCRDHMTALLAADPAEPWLAELLESGPASRELYRDPDHGFILLAHTEHNGLYRPPHDHGRSWVVYGTQSGAIEVGTYGAIAASDDELRLVKRDATQLAAGQAQAYLPGDVHDTRCSAPRTLLFRFTERDLKVEDREAGRMTRYVERGGAWTAPRR